MTLLLLALLAVNLAAHRAGVWRRYTPEDVACGRAADAPAPLATQAPAEPWLAPRPDSRQDRLTTATSAQ